MTIDDLQVGDTFSAKGPGIPEALQGKHWKVTGRAKDGRVIVDGPFDDPACTRRHGSSAAVAFARLMN
jgi:hypothetical protein